MRLRAFYRFCLTRQGPQAWPRDLSRSKKTSLHRAGFDWLLHLQAFSQERTDAMLTGDPFLWLEEIKAAAAVVWARAENELEKACQVASMQACVD